MTTLRDPACMTDGQAQLNKNVVNGSEPMPWLIGGLPSRTPVAIQGRLRLGLAGGDCSRTTGPGRTWCSRCCARRSPQPG